MLALGFLLPKDLFVGITGFDLILLAYAACVKMRKLEYCQTLLLWLLLEPVHPSKYV